MGFMECSNRKAFLVLLVAVVVSIWIKSMNDPLNDFNENTQFSIWTMRATVLGFCSRTQLVEDLLKTNDEDKNTPEDQYKKQSIYALLYNIYALVGKTSFNGIPYEFTFNTWGVAPTKYQGDPQQFGKEAYRRLTDFPAVKEKIASLDRPVRFLELGSGTGAGANLTSHIHSSSHYTALDMQSQGTNTCKRLHEHDAIPGIRGKLNCLQANAQEVPLESNSIDIIVICETHIAEMGSLTDEDKLILREVQRLLAPGGLFVWGNAIRTEAWDEIEAYFQNSESWDTIAVNDVTEGAIQARNEDVERVDEVIQDFHDMIWVTNYIPKCKGLISHLILDFYRNPGTRMYDTMVTRYHHYKQACFKLIE